MLDVRFFRVTNKFSSFLPIILEMYRCIPFIRSNKILKNETKFTKNKDISPRGYLLNVLSLKLCHDRRLLDLEQVNIEDGFD